jgi:hypothetical protein
MPNNNPDPDTTFNSEADDDPDPDPGPAPSFTHVGKSEFFGGLLFAPIPVYTVLSLQQKCHSGSAGPGCRSDSGSGKMIPIRQDPDPQHRFTHLKKSPEEHFTKVVPDNNNKKSKKLTHILYIENTEAD